MPNDRKNARRDPFTVFESYSFVDKDPIIYVAEDLIKSQGKSYRDIHDACSVGTGTLYGWFRGKTRRPQFATVVAVLRACGYDINVVPMRRGHKVGNIRMPKLRVVSG